MEVQERASPPVDYKPEGANLITIKWGGTQEKTECDIKVECPCSRCAILLKGYLMDIIQKIDPYFAQIKQHKEQKADK